MALNELSAQSVILQGDQMLIRPLSPTPPPETPVPPAIASALPPAAYPPDQGTNNPTDNNAYPAPVTEVSQFATLLTTPTPQFSIPAGNQPEDNNAANTTLTIFVIVGLLLLAFLLVVIIRQLRAQSFLP